MVLYESVPLTLKPNLHIACKSDVGEGIADAKDSYGDIIHSYLR